MNQRKLTTAIATTAFLAPIVAMSTAHAESSRALDHMMDTCIQQFVASTLAGYEGKVTVHKETSDHAMPLVAGQGSYRISVEAVGHPSGTSFGTATCEMNHKGEVISMKMDPTAAAKKAKKGDEAVVANNLVE